MVLDAMLFELIRLIIKRQKELTFLKNIKLFSNLILYYEKYNVGYPNVDYKNRFGLTNFKSSLIF